MSQPRKKIHLFNCDRTYKFDAIEGLLDATKAKVGSYSAERHYFSLAQMPEMTTKTIPNLDMDMAFFVVHAHESRLSINEDNAGIGYAKIYRALLEATGGNVIIVIGGDDNYKNEEEEDQVVISRWAKRKISSQFKDEFLDGRKSFIFSWNKKHRAIHEEALLHYLHPSKKGQKFEYQPKPKEREVSKSAQSLQRGQSMDEERRGDSLFSSSKKTGQRSREDWSFSRSNTYSGEQRREDSIFSRSNSAEQRPEDGLFRTSNNWSEQRRDNSSFSHSNKPEQRREDSSLFSSSNSAEKKREDSLFDSSTATTGGNMTPFYSEQSTRSASTRTERKDLAVLGCNVSPNSMQAVRKVFQDKIVPKLNLTANPPIENFPPIRVKQYLTENHLKFCVLAVDAETVKDAYGHLTQRKVEYEELLKTAANAVDEKVVILICDNVSLKSEDDELIVGQTIERTINEKGKGFVAWLKNGKLSVDPDVVVQFFISPSPAPQPHPQTNLSRDFQQMTTVPVSAAGSIATCSYQRKRNPRYPPEWETGPGWNVPNMQQPAPQTAVTINQWRPPAVTITGEAVLLRSLLRYGKISYHLQDLQLWDPEFFVPDYIAQKLFNKHCNTPVTGVRIVSDHDGQPECSVGQTPKDISKSIKEGVKIAANETLLLKTCIRDGLVSFQENDVDFRYGSFRIPENITDGLRDENQSTPCADLYIILNEKRDLRCIVKLGPIDRIRTFASKRGIKI